MKVIDSYYRMICHQLNLGVLNESCSLMQINARWLIFQLHAHLSRQQALS